MAEKNSTVADDLVVGGENLALWLYGKCDPQAMREVYRNPMGLTFFSHGGRKAGFKSTLRRELAEIEDKARKARQTAA